MIVNSPFTGRFNPFDPLQAAIAAGHAAAAAIFTVLNAAATEFICSRTVRNEAATEFSCSHTVRDEDGNSFTVT